MSATELRVIEGGKQTFRTVEVVRQAESDRWAIVEAIQEDIDDSPLSARALSDDTANKGEEYRDLCRSIADRSRGKYRPSASHVISMAETQRDRRDIGVTPDEAETRAA